MNIIETLQKYNYNNVVIIDDKIGITDSTVTIENLRKLDNKNMLNDARLSKYKLSSFEIPYRDFHNEELNNYIDGVFVDELNLSLFVKDLSEYEGLIKKVDFDDDSNIRKLNNNILWIMDRKLENSYEGHIKKVISLYTNRLQDGHQDVLIFYTRELEQIKNYDDMKLFIEQQTNRKVTNEIMYINALSKDQPIDALYIERAIQKISKVRIFEMFSEDSEKTIDKIRQKLYDKSYYYDYLIDYDYLSEGKNAFKAFSHILISTFNNDFFSIDSGKKSVIEKTNDISNKKFQNSDEFDKYRTKLIARIIKAYHKILNPSEIQKNLDHENDDIEIGDIFKIGSNYYLLIHQECDLIIRENGKRKSDSLKLIKLKYKEEDNPNEHVKNEISRVIGNETKGFDKKFPGKDKNQIVSDAVEIIKEIDPSFPYSSDQLFNEPTVKKGYFVKNEDKIALVDLDASYTVIFLNAWLLDSSVYYKLHDHSFVLLSLVEKKHKISTSLRIGDLNKHWEEVKTEAKQFGVTLENYLKVKTGISITKKKSGDILIPIRRVARLPRDMTLDFIVELSNHETRKAVQDIITIH